MNIVRNIQNRIYEIRGERVMLDFDLAALYEVTTKVLNQAVKRNLKRFPKDFMFRLTIAEWQTIRSQIVTAYESPNSLRSQNETLEKTSKPLGLQNETSKGRAINCSAGTMNIYKHLESCHAEERGISESSVFEMPHLRYI